MMTICESNVAKIEAICKEYNCDKGELINVLHQTQNTFGYLPEDVQEIIAENLQTSLAQVYGVVSFYSFFTMIPKGKHPVNICKGTACYVRGAEKIIDEFKTLLDINIGETTADEKFSLSSLRCIGACGLAPVVLIGDKVYGRVTLDSVKEILDEYQ
ncbi:NAD(P)H-dependent oxidoreductase subunit E [Flavobacterium franklandianum]|uniref:NAD(P)H-dependent oxidoreductase subunit E n=1 Tax=Flavobacterium franklandianum TaxID=2594430 RepID=A0A553CM22_9FLAO|nr:NAD(P)H-dependent oxidoreductase subunit E [Flavobacterium franklandianum]TRX21570.1 NAD(P)H-dependent oxidoreductase subunit E [Flavobacterium franklandianum]TRX22467.1 NAD(P)H-dependent oxidoreductase subunit E [Flavobacterium franklandianum]